MKLRRFEPFLKATAKNVTSVSAKPVLATQQKPNIRSTIDLPRLPVPPLSQTLEKYLNTVRPHVNEEEFKKTLQVVRNFGQEGGLGEKLQSLLLNRAQNTENWLSAWWKNIAYFDFRSPLVIHSSAGIAGPQFNFKTDKCQLHYAARLIAGALDFKKLIDDGTLPVDQLAGTPLDMTQYFKILSSCRVPGEKRDSGVYYFRDSNSPTHIIVIRNNCFFKVNVYDRNGNPLSESQLLDQLIRVESESNQKAKPVGILTSQHRDEWFKTYTKLSRDPENRRTIEEIQRSIFVLCLDGSNPQIQSQRVETGQQVLHGGGSKLNSGNRWFDKTIQFIVGRTGEIGVMFEHSPTEGGPPATLLDHVISYIESSKIQPNADGSFTNPQQLTFNLSNELHNDIETATRQLDQLTNDVELNLLYFNSFGKEFIKTLKVSPDSLVQMALQLAFYRLHGEVGACYESASTRKYNQGRTETIRSASNESTEMCRIFLNNRSTLQERAVAVRKAIEAHKNYANDAVLGQGVDRHLLGLKLTALENGIELPAIYKNPAFAKSSHFRLSTSQVASTSDCLTCFGPGVADGYGICYSIRPYQINMSMSAFKSNPVTSSEKLKSAVAISLLDLSLALQSALLHSKL